MAKQGGCEYKGDVQSDAMATAVPVRPDALKVNCVGATAEDRVRNSGSQHDQEGGGKPCDFGGDLSIDDVGALTPSTEETPVWRQFDDTEECQDVEIAEVKGKRTVEFGFINESFDMDIL